MINLACCVLLAVAPLQESQESGRREVLANPASSEAPKGLPTESPARGASYDLEVSFLITVDPNADAPALSVAGISVELGAGLRAEAGSVFWARPVLGRAFSDEAGIVRTTLRVPEHWLKQRSATIWARVERTGCIRSIALHPVRGGGRREPVELRLSAGGTLVGVVKDSSGVPVPRAEYFIYGRGRGGADPAPPQPVFKWWRRVSRTDPSGRFAAHYFEHHDYDLVARASGLGSAVLRLPGLAPEPSPGAFAAGEQAPAAPALDATARPIDAPIELVLIGGVSLRGQVRDEAGHPVPGLTIRAVPSSGPSGGMWPGVRIDAEVRGGLLGDTTRTDIEGRFELPALVPGEYALLGEYGNGQRLGSGSAEELRASAAFLGVGRAPSDGTASFELRVPRLELSVMDARGIALDPELALEPGHHKADDAPMLEVSRQRAGLWQVVEGQAVGRLAVFPAEPDTEYRITWLEPGRPLFETTVRAAPGSVRTPVRIELGRSGGPAHLTVLVLDPAGPPFIGAGAFAAPIVTVQSATTGRELASSAGFRLIPREPLEDSSWSTELPAGRYRVELRGPPNTGCISAPPYPRIPCLPATAEVVLETGERRQVELQFGAAGHLDLVPDATQTLRPMPLLAELKQLLVNFRREGSSLDWARDAFSGVDVELRPSGDGSPLHPTFDVAELAIIAPYGLTWIVPGWSARGLSPIPVGDWILRLERRGELLFQRPVTIREGEVTTVRW